MNYEPFTITELNSGKLTIFASIPINEGFESNLNTKTNGQFTGSGHDWGDLFKKLLHKKDQDLLNSIIFDCEGGMFSILVDSEESAEQFYKYYLEIIKDPKQIFDLYD